MKSANQFTTMDNRDKHSPSGLAILPPIERKSFLTPSCLNPFTEHRRRTIKTEFGTIVVDGEHLVVQSNITNPSITPQSTATLLALGNAYTKESLLATPTLPESPSEKMAVTLAVEQSQRQDRGMWLSNTEMMMFTLSSFMGFMYAIRRPKLWMEFGGGAFTLAFAVCNVVITMPLLLLEAALGQFAGHGMAGLMPQMAPALRGYPYALLFCLTVKTISWMTNVSTAGIYFVEALHHRPCWMNCNASFNTDRCYTHLLDRECQDRGALLFAAGRCVSRQELCPPTNSTAHLSPTLDSLAAACAPANGSASLNRSVLLEVRELAAAEYFYNVKQTDVKSQQLHAHGRSILALLGCWLLLALVSQVGLELVGYTLPLLLGLPVCIFIALMANELVVGKNFSGLWEYLVPRAEHLSDYRCWFFAATSSLLAPNIGTGLNSVIFARNPPRHDCQHSTLILIAVSFTVNILWSLSITIVMARYASDIGKDVKELMLDYSNEPELVMITSSLGMGDTQVWMALFLLFTMLLAMGTAQAGVLVIETSLRELSVLTRMSTRSAVCLICSAGFLLDLLLFALPSGPHLNAAISTYGHSYFNVMLALVLMCAVNVTLGVDRVLDALTQQMAVPLRWSRWFWTLSWRCLCPLLLLGMFVSNVWHHASRTLRYRGAQVSGWTAALAVVLAVAPLLLLFIEVFRAYAEAGSGEGEQLYRPTERWQLGLLSVETCAAAAAGGDEGTDGGRQRAPRQTKSLMTRMYGAVSSRWLFAKGSLARLESRVVPVDAGPSFLQTRPVPGPSGLASKLGLNSRSPGAGLESTAVLHIGSPSGLESKLMLSGDGSDAVGSETVPKNSDPGGPELEAAPTDGIPAVPEMEHGTGTDRSASQTEARNAPNRTKAATGSGSEDDQPS